MRVLKRHRCFISLDHFSSNDNYYLHCHLQLVHVQVLPTQPMLSTSLSMADVLIDVKLYPKVISTRIFFFSPLWPVYQMLTYLLNFVLHKPVLSLMLKTKLLILPTKPFFLPIPPSKSDLSVHLVSWPKSLEAPLIHPPHSFHPIHQQLCAFFFNRIWNMSPSKITHTSVSSGFGGWCNSCVSWLCSDYLTVDICQSLLNCPLIMDEFSTCSLSFCESDLIFCSCKEILHSVYIVLPSVL